MRVVALDVHRSFAQVAELEDGVLRQRGRVDLVRHKVLELARTLRPDDEVVLEATGNTMAIVRLLKPHVGRVVIANPLQVRVIAEAKAKGPIKLAAYVRYKLGDGIDRPTTDFLWQRSPYQLANTGGGGVIEGAGLDYILPYWMARYYGVIAPDNLREGSAASYLTTVNFPKRYDKSDVAGDRGQLQSTGCSGMGYLCGRRGVRLRCL